MVRKINETRTEDDVETELHGTHPLPEQAEDDVEFSETLVINNDQVDDAAARPAEQLQPGSLLRDRYVLRERLPDGGMGRVYKALDRHLSDASGGDVVVALKILAPHLAQDPDALRALQQEAAKGRCLSHPGIVRFIDLDREGELYFIVMEWLDGQSLGELLDQHKLGSDKERVFGIVRQVAEALDYAHKRGVIHADIKPGNVMLLPDGTAKLIDFGIARVRQQESLASQETAALRSATPAYSSLQVLTGEEPVASDDVFSLACLTYRLVARHRVFGPRNAAEAAAEGLEPQRPQGLSDEEWAALKKALSFSRVARQRTPLQFVDELTHRGDAQQADAPLVVPPEEVQKRRFGEKKSHLPVALMFLLLLAVAAIYFLRPPWLEPGLDRVNSFVADVRRRAAALSTGLATVDEPDVVQNAAVRQPSLPAEPEVDEAAEPQPAAAQVAAEDAAFAAPSPAEATTEEPVAAAPVEASAPDPREVASGGPARLELAAAGRSPSRVFLSIREDGDPAVIELERQGALMDPLLVRVDEVGFSGLRSPGNAGEYRLSENGVVSFDAGQRSATLSIEVLSNTEREPDRQVTLRLRDYYDAESVLGQIDLRLLDDDQRVFEAGIPVNSISFATARAVVAENDPAAQIEVLRYNPSNDTQVVIYYVRDDSAVEGEDYFAPTQRVITFGPGQRNARLLIPLVQDTVEEGDEYFTVELDQGETHERLVDSVSVVIRDDDLFASQD